MIVQFLEILKAPAETSFLATVEWSAVPRSGDDIMLNHVPYLVERVQWELSDGCGKAFVYLKKKSSRRKT